MIRSYSELIRLRGFIERYEYLRLGGIVGETTFGFNRVINQSFYRSREWRGIRRDIIIRDEACDLGVPDYEINDQIIIHHIMPITEYDIINLTKYVTDPEYLICTSSQTHNAIHFGDASLLPKLYFDRTPGDTRLW